MNFLKRNFVFGQVLSFSDLPTNAIALDGAVQGPQVDAAGRKFSFDHHAGCTRLVTLATCQQVAIALKLGLVVDAETEIYINDLDADTVLSVWLLENSERAGEARVVELVERVGLTDAHGPIFPPHPLHREIGPAYGSKDPQTLAMLDAFLAKVGEYADGTWQAPPARPERLSNGFGWSPKTGWKFVEAQIGFDSLYNAGYLAGVLYTEGANETTMYTIGKRSDLVPLPVGPGSVERPPKSNEDYRQDTILGRLALAELEANPTQTHAANWGGATTVGGSPRNEVEVDGKKVNCYSKLKPEQVLEICKSFTGGK